MHGASSQSEVVLKAPESCEARCGERSQCIMSTQDASLAEFVKFVQNVPLDR